MTESVIWNLAIAALFIALICRFAVPAFAYLGNAYARLPRRAPQPQAAAHAGPARWSPLKIAGYGAAIVLLAAIALWYFGALSMPQRIGMPDLSGSLLLIAIAAAFVLLCWWAGASRWAIVALVVICVLLIAFQSSLTRMYREQTAHGPRAASVHGQAPDGQQAEDSSCAKFSFDGASCEARTDTGWIRPEAGTPAGLTFCWNPESSTGAFDRIMYLDEGGAPHTFVPGHAPEHATAYRFFPSHRYLKEHGMRSLAITYYLYDGECPAD